MERQAGPFAIVYVARQLRGFRRRQEFGWGGGGVRRQQPTNPYEVATSSVTRV
jgi:hypothetical protein